jgi:hypothetical protein
MMGRFIASSLRSAASAVVGGLSVRTELPEAEIAERFGISLITVRQTCANSRRQAHPQTRRQAGGRRGASLPKLSSAFHLRRHRGLPGTPGSKWRAISAGCRAAATA